MADWWLAAEHELGAWVAKHGDRVVGHVALRPAGGAGLPGWQQATGRGPEGLAVVSRRFTDRSLPGAGAALLAEAVAQALAAGREPVMQVDPDSAALDWYRRRGWREVGARGRPGATGPWTQRCWRRRRSIFVKALRGVREVPTLSDEPNTPRAGATVDPTAAGSAARGEGPPARAC